MVAVARTLNLHRVGNVFSIQGKRTIIDSSDDGLTNNKCKFFWSHAF